MTAGPADHAIIAGSGFHAFANEGTAESVATEYGAPSGPVRCVSIGGHSVWYLPRHGDDLMIAAHAVNYRANLRALQMLGARRVIALNTVGVIAGGLHPGELAIPDQIIDYTWGREHTIFGTSHRLEHIDFTEPFAPAVRRALLDAAKKAGVPVRDGGVYAVTQGPRLETAAEVDRLERDGADYIGMTAMPEASLAFELGLGYACLSLIVNYAAGRGEKAIHADIEASTMAAREKALRIVAAYFGAAT